nr:replication protein A 70 kDa DNA-binding subunit B [Tanacetum cinerariifolium]
MKHTLTQLCDIDPMLDDIKISSLVFHPYLPLQIPDIKIIKVDPMLYDINVIARCISIWKAHPSGNPNNICCLDIVFQDHQVEFRRISLIGFRSCASRSQTGASQSRQSTE